MAWRWFVLTGYAVLVGLVVSRHEPWFDEMHVWMMARENSFSDLLGLMKYEGNPVLWHMLVKVLAELGLGPGSMHGLAWVISVGAVAWMLFRSPLPESVKTVLPFSYWLAYQYSVVARNYTLLAPLLFYIASQWRHRESRFGRIVVALALLAWVTSHGFIIAGCLGAILVWELFRKWRGTSSFERRCRVAWLGGLLLFALVTVWYLRSPPDLNFHMPRHEKWFALVSTARLIVDRVWTPWRWLTVVTLIATVIWFFRQRILILWLVPTVAVSILFWLVYGEDRHVGVLYLLWITCLWISFDACTALQHRATAVERRTFALLFTCLAACQLYWTVQTIAYDWEFNYGGAKDAANYLKEEGLASKRICAVGFHCAAVLPYFDRNVYMNWNDGSPPAGWWWSTQFKHYDSSELIIQARPDVILRTLKPPLWSANVEYPGYRKVAEAQGGIYVQDRIKEEDSYQIWVRDPLKQ